MRKKVLITEAKFNEEEKELILGVEDDLAIGDLKPMEQMLVDSDHFSFIYIADLHDEYTYIAIPDSIWPEIKKAYDLQAPILLSNQNERLLLKGFHDELGYLIDNIKGNSNYGEEMVAKVESTF